MNVGFGVTVLARGISSSGVDGIGNCTRQLLHRLLSYKDFEISPVSFGYELVDPDYPYFQLLKRYAPCVPFSILTGLPFPGTSLIRRKIDLFHATDHHIPNLRTVPVIATIHDAIPLAHPEWVPIKYQLMIVPAFKRSVKWASQIITVSEYSKQQIAEHFKVPIERIVVIPNGVDAIWAQSVDLNYLDTLKAKFHLNKPYIIFVGTLQPRKNVQRLIEAYRRMTSRICSSFDLLIVGRNGWGVDDLLRTLKDESASKGVHWLRYVPDKELITLVKGASCLAMPSLSEGFGLPIVEAFAAGVPVLASNQTSFPEIASGAAVLINPYDIDAISHGLEKILDNEHFANDLRARGRDRALLYTWEHAAERTAQLYKNFE